MKADQTFARACTVMPAILRACAKIPRSYGYLERKTGSTRGSLHVLCMRLRNDGLLQSIDGGTHHVKHLSTESRKP